MAWLAAKIRISYLHDLRPRRLFMLPGEERRILSSPAFHWFLVGEPLFLSSG